jgi:hypothetical protein
MISALSGGSRLLSKRKPDVKKSDTRYTASELLRYIKPIRIERDEDNLRLFCCDLVGDEAPHPHFERHQQEARIDIEPTRGRVLIWHFEYRPGDPDVIIEGLVSAAKE